MMKDGIRENLVNSSGKLITKRFQTNRELCREIIEATSFLSDNVPLSERIYCVLNDIVAPIKCANPECNNDVPFISFGYGYNSYCCRSCIGKSQDFRNKLKEMQKRVWSNKSREDIEIALEKRDQTNLEKYGVKNIAQNSDIKEKISETLKEKYRAGEITSSFANDKTKDKIKEIVLKKYHVDHVFKSSEVKDKIKETNLENLGNENYFSSEKGKENIRNIFKKKYGVENPQQVQEIKDKTQQTNLSVYGNKCTLVNPIVKAKSKITMLEKYGADHPMRSEIIQDNRKRMSLQEHNTKFPSQKHISRDSLDKLSDCEWLYEQHYNLKKSTTQISRELGVSDTLTSKRMHLLDLDVIRHPMSSEEYNLIEYIRSIYDGEIKTNVRDIISPLEIDIFIPEMNIAIEYDGLYWHSYNSLENENRSKHLLKTNLCLEKGIRLFNIFENEWLDDVKKDIWKSIILNCLGKIKDIIYARKCDVKKIEDRKIISKFLSDNHLQGNGYGISDSYGLFYNNELVQVLSMGRSRFNRNIEYEIIRSCTRKNIRIIGGMGKLISCFIDDKNPKNVITYVDRRYGEGLGYLNLKFKFIKTTNPGYFYFKNGTLNLESRLKFKKNKLKDILENFDSNLSESVNMFNNGYRRIWDCGHNVYVYEK